jgi:hypothetical protein
MRARSVSPGADNDGMEASTFSPRRRPRRRFDLSDPALWAWAVVVVMIAVPAVGHVLA